MVADIDFIKLQALHYISSTMPHACPYIFYLSTLCDVAFYLQLTQLNAFNSYYVQALALTIKNTGN